MDIVIGESARIGPSDQYRTDGGEPLPVEARLLGISDKREPDDSGRPSCSRVITLLVPEGQKIPRGLESGDYRIYLRFVHRRQARF